MTERMTEPLLKATDVARLLNVSLRLVYQMAQDGRIPSIRIGGPDGPLRFRAEDVEGIIRGSN